jgi:diaminopimelate decarboxylase
MSAVDDITARLAGENTPRRIFRPGIARERLALVARLRDGMGRPPLALVAAFSFKTNPRAELIEQARARGFFAEVISHDELEWARRVGFAPEETIYNGPEPLLERSGERRLAYAFADSLEAFERNLQRNVAMVQGVRLRPSMIASRFGIPIEDEPELAAVVRTIPAEAPLAVSYHARHGDFKGAGWRDVAGDVLDRADELQRSTGRQVTAFDAGGGWTPEEFDTNFEPDMRWLVERIRAALPSCAQLIFEPGQAVCTPTEALLTTVLEVRRRRGRNEVIVDVGYSDWPEMHEYPHAMFAWRDDAWQRVGHGPDRLGGRTCLEYDLIEGLRFPPDIAPGDRLLIADTGSYDRSMSFQFARGDAPHATLRD